MINCGYILTHSSWKTSNFLSQPSLEKTGSRLEGRHYSLSSAFIMMPLYLTEPTRILQKAAQKQSVNQNGTIYALPARGLTVTKVFFMAHKNGGEMC